MNSPAETEIAAKCSYCGRRNADCVVWCPGCGTSLIQERDVRNKQRSLDRKATLIMVGVFVKIGVKLAVLLVRDTR